MVQFANTLLSFWINKAQTFKQMSQMFSRGVDLKTPPRESQCKHLIADFFVGVQNRTAPVWPRIRIQGGYAAHSSLFMNEAAAGHSEM